MRNFTYVSEYITGTEDSEEQYVPMNQLYWVDIESTQWVWNFQWVWNVENIIENCSENCSDKYEISVKKNVSK